MIKFDRRYFQLTLILFAIEVFIAVFIRDRFIRPFVGDVLVVILLYCSVKSFVNQSTSKVAFAVLIFAVAIEVLQYFQLVDRLGLHDNQFARIVLGSTFDWMDLVAYTIGTIVIVGLERQHKTS